MIGYAKRFKSEDTNNKMTSFKIDGKSMIKNHDEKQSKGTHLVSLFIGGNTFVYFHFLGFNLFQKKY